MKKIYCKRTNRKKVASMNAHSSARRQIKGFLKIMTLKRQ